MCPVALSPTYPVLGGTTPRRGVLRAVKHYCQAHGRVVSQFWRKFSLKFLPVWTAVVIFPLKNANGYLCICRVYSPAVTSQLIPSTRNEFRVEKVRKPTMHSSGQ